MEATKKNLQIQFNFYEICYKSSLLIIIIIFRTFYHILYLRTYLFPYTMSSEISFNDFEFRFFFFKLNYNFLR